MATKVVSLYGELNLEDNMTPALKAAQKESKTFSDRIKDAGKSVTNLGQDMVRMSAPFVGGIGLAVKAAMDFDEQITNIASVMLLGRDEADAMGQAMLSMSRDTKFSATELALSMYDVVGGVSNASEHMNILAASAALAEGSNANLSASTNALISSYNAYSSAGVEASRVSDVMTMTVRNGVGTMGELAGVFGRTSTLASPLGIDIEELGFLFAELSKKGATFSESGTRIEGAISALINPTKELETAFDQMGMTQADVLAMLESEGLTAVVKEMVDAGVDLTAVFGDKEALLGVLSIAGIDSGGLETFTTNIEGATEAARAIQAEGQKFKWDTLVGDFSDLAVVAGQALAPAFSGVIDELSPMVQDFADWAKQNPQTIQDIAKLALGAMALGLVMTPLGWVVSGFGTILSGVVTVGANLAAIAVWGFNAAVAVALSPITWLVTAIGGLLLVLGGGEGGLLGGFNRAVTAARQLVELGIYFVLGALTELSNSPLFVAIRTAFETAFNAIRSVVEGVVGFIGGLLDGIFQTIEDILTGLGLIEGKSNVIQNPTQAQIDTASAWNSYFSGNGVNPSTNNGFQIPNNPNNPLLVGFNNSSAGLTPFGGGKADGGDVWAGMPYIVGERGQEWFVPQTNGTIFNQRQIAQMGNSISIGTLVLNGVQDPQSLYDALQKVARQRA